MPLLSSPGHHSVFQVSQQRTPYPRGRQSSRSRSGQSQHRTIMTKAEKSGVCVFVCVFLSDFANPYVRPLFLNIHFTGSGVWVTCEFVGNTEWLTTPDLLTQICLIIRSLGDGSGKKAGETLHWLTFCSSQTRCSFLHLLGSLFFL